MPTENRSSNEQKMVSVPPYIGQEPLVGRYYPAKCRDCGWVGSSEELTEDDAQCTRDVGDSLCLGDCDELDRDDLLGIIQAMAQQQGEPVALPERIDPTQQWHIVGGIAKAEGWNVCLDEISKLGPLYKHADSGEVERLREELAQEKKAHMRVYDVHQHVSELCHSLRAKLAEREALLRAQDDLLAEAYQYDIGTPLKRKIRANRAALAASAGASEREAWALREEKRLGVERLPAEPSAPVELCNTCKGYGKYQDGDSGTDEDGRAPNIVECECDDSERMPQYRASAPVERDERAEFEAWGETIWFSSCFERGDEGEYSGRGLNGAWMGWQARAALERKPEAKS